MFSRRAGHGHPILMVKAQVPSLSLRFDARSQVLSIKDGGIVFENPCSNLLPLEVDKHLPLLHLICVFLLFLVKCCSRSSPKAARQFRCSASSPRGVSRPLFPRFPFRWVLQFALSLTRCLNLQDVVPCSGKDLPFEWMAPAEPNHIDAGGSANQRYRFHLLQDVTDQIHYTPTSGSHVR